MNYTPRHITPVLAVLFLLLGFNTNAQEYLVQKRSFRSGEEELVSRFVRSMTKGQDGVIWISTSEGLQSYDGVTFKFYNRAKYGLSSSSYSQILTGPQGMIWLMQFNNHQAESMLGKYYEAIDLLDPVSDTVYSFQEYFGSDAPPVGQFFGITQDSDRSLNIGTDRGEVYRYDGRLQKVFETDHPVTLIRRASPSSWWVVRPGALVEQSDTGELLSVDSLGFFPIYMEEGGQDAVLLRTASNHRFNFAKGHPFAHKRRGFPLGPRIFFADGRPPVDLTAYTNVWIDQQHRLWVHNRGSLQYLSWAGKVEVEIPLLENNMAQIIEQIFFDPDGLIWFQFGQQFSVYGITKNQFTKYLSDRNVSVRDMLPLGDDRVLINNYKGACILDLRTREEKVLRPEGAIITGMGFWRDPDETIWTGGHLPYVMRITSDRYAIDSFQLVAKGQPWFDVNVIIRDSRQTLWVGSNVGLFYRGKSERTFHHLELPELKKERIVINWIEEYRDTLWIGTRQGLVQMDLNTLWASVSESVPQVEYYHLHVDSEENFWLASRGNGLIRWDRKSDTSETLSVEEGLSSNIIYGILEDEQRNLWLSSQYGLMRYNPKSKEIVTFTMGEGLPDNEFNYLAYAAMPDGTFLFGGVNGLIHFNPDSIWSQLPFINAQPTLTEIQKISTKTGEASNTTNDYLETKVLNIYSSDVSTIVRFSLFDYLDTREPSYSYFIEGLDKNWNYINENYIRLNRMPFGSYRLRIRPNGLGGAPGKDELVIPVRVIKPWYQRTGNIAAGVTGLILLIVGTTRFQVRRLKRKNRQLDQKVLQRTAQIRRVNEDLQKKNRDLQQANKVKDKLFTIIGHELRGPIISLGSLMENVAYLIEENQMDRAVVLGRAADESVQRLRLLIENMMNWGRAESGELPYRPEIFDPVEILEEITAFYERSITEKEIDINVAQRDEMTLFADRNAFRIIVMNLLNNAIKYTDRGGKVNIVLTERTREEVGVIAFQDSGIGMLDEQIEFIFQESYFSRPGTKNEKGIGIGLKVCRELVKINKGKLTARSMGKNQGAVFSLELPLGASAGRRRSDSLG